MQNEFDSWDSNPGFDSGPGSGAGTPLPGSGGWHWLQTLVSVVIVGLLSTACAYLTRNVEERPVWMMGLIFMVPTAAMMAATLLVERVTSAMTPVTSRRPQLILAVTATVLTFIVACICDLVYLYGFKKPLPPAGAEEVPYETSDRLLILSDPTRSMEENGAGKKAAGIVSSLLDSCRPEWEVGLCTGRASVSLSPLTNEQKKKILNETAKTPDQGRLYYQDMISSALDMAERAGAGQGTRILLLTDGLHAWSREEETDLAARCRNAGVTVSLVQLGESPDPSLARLIQETGGKILAPEDAARILEGMQTTRFRGEIRPAAVEEKLKLDLLRNREPAAILISCVMLLLEGLSLGVCISLMLSVKGQFRFQFILSPLMGLLAFALLKFIWDNDDIATTWWIKEAAAFSLLGVVLMKRNRRSGAGSSSAFLSSGVPDNDTDF